MRILFATAVIALAGLFSGAMSDNAAASGNARWCMHAPWLHETRCSYQTLARCEKYEKPNNGWCTLNPKFVKSQQYRENNKK
jgi:hypothetical protein